MIRVLLVDDQTNVRRGLRMRLSLEPDLTVVGEAPDGETALRLARLLNPNVVVMDIEMPGMNGIDCTRELIGERPDCAVVVLSLHDNTTNRVSARTAGASAFVAKHQVDTVLMDAIRGAAQREAEHSTN